jgi:CTP synthase
VQPDVLVLRTEHPIDGNIRAKVALFCNVAIEAVVESIDVPTIYEVPIKMQEEKLDVTVLKKLDLPISEDIDLDSWNDFLHKLKNPERTVDIALVGKYVELHDAYKSICESLIHAGAINKTKVNVKWVHSESVTPATLEKKLKNVQGILVAPGFGHRGIKGKILAVQYARENNIPFFGICLGMQMAVIEFARNVLQLEGADSTEMNAKTSYPVIDLMEQQKEVIDYGGTMRLGAYDCRLVSKKSNTFGAYNKYTVRERHRHRFEFNNAFLSQFEKAGMKATGINPETDLVEIIEIPQHKWFVGVQFHPEYRSTVLNPHPLFVDFIKNALSQ